MEIENGSLVDEYNRQYGGIFYNSFSSSNTGLYIAKLSSVCLTPFIIHFFGDFMIGRMVQLNILENILIDIFIFKDYFNSFFGLIIFLVTYKASFVYTWWIQILYISMHTLWNINFSKKLSGFKGACIHNIVAIIISLQLTTNKDVIDGILWFKLWALGRSYCISIFILLKLLYPDFKDLLNNH
tara:strand:- start:115 stop:666 length:552 start_codon:yes stop_codon:yes gene_type:complete